MYNRRLTVPRVSLIAPVVALLTMRLVMVATEALGSFCNSKAATPATCGLAMEVPLMVLEPPLNQVDVMLEPGPKMSTQEPKLEKPERASLMVVEPTVMALAARAGEKPVSYTHLRAHETR